MKVFLFLSLLSFAFCIPFYVLLPDDIISRPRAEMFKILHRYKAIGVDGVSSFVYWDTFESDKSDELSKLKTFVGIVHNVGLKWIPRLSFHDFDHFPQVVKEFITSGNNNIDLSNYSYNDSVDGSNAKKSRSPDNESNSKSNGYYRCLYGLDMNNANFYYKHSISLMCDDLKPFNGNSALDLYYSFLRLVFSLFVSGYVFLFMIAFSFSFICF